MSWLAGKMTAAMVKKAAPFVLVGLIMFVIWLLWSSNQKLNEELGKLRAELAIAVDVNTTNQESIDALDRLLDECTERFDQSVEDNRVALATLQKDYEALKKQKDRVHVELREIFRTPSCEELGSIDVNATCPALASELRLLANGVDQN